MCRSRAEGGRRCPCQGYSSSRENQAARKQLSRARRNLTTAEAAGDSARITKAQAQVAAAQARVEASKSSETAAAGTVRVVDAASRAGASARKPAGAPAGAPASAPTTDGDTTRTRQDEVREVINAFGATATRGDYLRMTDLRAALPPDMTRDEVDAVLRRMNKAGEIELTPDPARMRLTQADHDSAIRLSAADEYDAANHLITFQAPREPVRDPASALQRIRDRGVSAAADDDLKAVFGARDIDVPLELGQAIWRERQRRQDAAKHTTDAEPRTEPNDQPAPAPKAATAAQPPAPHPAKESKDAAARRQPATPVALQVDGPPVDGQPSRKPLLDNHWGGRGTADGLYYHSDGAIGEALERMGPDARMAVDGQPLHNVLGRVATEVVQGRRTAQEGVDAYKKIRDRLPSNSRARQHLDDAIRHVDAPHGSAPVLPKDTPEPLRQLAADLHAVPVCRAQPDIELELVTRLANDLAAGKRVRPATEVRRLLGRRHESDGDMGYFEIRRAVAKALKALR